MTTIRNGVTVAGILVLVSATVHLALGLAGLSEAVANGTGGVALPVLFLGAAILVYALVGAYATGRLEPPVAYAVGTILMAGYALAYADWHAIGIGETLFPVEGTGLDHDHQHGHDHGHDHHGHDHQNGRSTLETLIDHLRDDPFAIVSKTAEVLAAAILGVLYHESKN